MNDNFLNIMQTGAFLFLLSLLSPVSAQSVFDFPSDRSFVVIEYSHFIGMIQNQDTLPVLRIYGDGTVRVHFPKYYKRAGDYEMRLSADELAALLRTFDSYGMFQFDSAKVKLLTQQSKAQQRVNIDETWHRSEETISRINVNLHNYIAQSSVIPVANLKKSIVWKNLKWDSRQYSDVPELVNAAAVEVVLRQLLQHQRLQKVD